MKNVTTKQSIASIFTRIWLLVLFVLNFATFAGIFMIILFPDFSALELNKSFRTFSMWSSNNDITNWGNSNIVFDFIYCNCKYSVNSIN